MMVSMMKFLILWLSSKLNYISEDDLIYNFFLDKLICVVERNLPSNSLLRKYVNLRLRKSSIIKLLFLHNYSTCIEENYLTSNVNVFGN